MEFHRFILKEEFTRRCNKNAQYSLRAFAKALEVDVSALSKAFSDKQPLSLKVARKVSALLELSPIDQRKFVESVGKQHSQKRVKRFLESEYPSGENEDFEEIDFDKFRIISEWYHYAILELTFTLGFTGDPRYIAKKLGITIMEAHLALERLITQGLVERKNGKLVKARKNITTKNKNVTTPAYRKLQRRILEKAIFSLENDPLEERNMSSMTFAIDPAKVLHAKSLITEFMRSLSKFLETGVKRRVYHLAISLYPVETKGGQGAKNN